VLAVVLIAATLTASSLDDLILRAQVMVARGEYHDAIAQLEPVSTRTPLTPLQRARLFQALAAARSQVGQPDRALADADIAEAAARSIDAFDMLARIESVRGAVALDGGRFLDAVRRFEICLSWAQKSGVAAIVAGAYIRLAGAYQDLGDWTRALDAVNRSAEADPHPSDASREQYLLRRGLLEIELHEGAAAKASIGEALAIARRIGDHRAEAQALGDLALAVERVDLDVRGAAALARQAVDVAHAMKAVNVEINALNELGSLLRRTDDDLPEARRCLERALAAIETSNERRDEPYVLKNLGQALVRLGHTDEGERVLRRAAERADTAGLSRVRWIARLELAQIDVARNPDAADREFQETLAILEEHQTNVLLEGFRAGALNQTIFEYDPYDRYVAFLLARGDAARAFVVAERERARAFLDRLSSARDALASAVPPGFADAENAILRHISTRQAQLRAGLPTEDARQTMLGAIDRDESELTALRLRLVAERPALAHARYPKIWNVADLQSSALAADERLVSFFLGADRSVCWIVDRSRLTTIDLPPRADVERAVRDALLELRDPASRGDARLRALSSVLAVGRIARLAAGARRLVVIPHGILYDVPFEALVDDAGRPLIERAAVSYAPSTSSFAFFRSLAPAPSALTTLVAVGDPVVASREADRHRQVDLARVDLLTPLPYSRDEIAGIASLFWPRVRLLEGRDATEGALRASDVGGARILHFATHGVMDETRPERSGLVLTAAASDDGLLQAREIYSLKLQADLVTLSACQTALGQNVTGEGVIGLTRAFFYAGARAVVASLWDIEDASTAEFMKRFYANVRGGDPIDIALQRAKIEAIRRGGETGRPFYWAPFVAIGRTDAPIDVPRSISVSVISATIASLALALAILVGVRRRARGVT